MQTVAPISKAWGSLSQAVPSMTGRTQWTWTMGPLGRPTNLAVPLLDGSFLPLDATCEVIDNLIHRQCAWEVGRAARPGLGPPPQAHRAGSLWPAVKEEGGKSLGAQMRRGSRGLVLALVMQIKQPITDQDLTGQLRTSSPYLETQVLLQIKNFF